MWVRGLKLPYIEFEDTYRKSHPMWVRGLKLMWKLLIKSHWVAPYVGAWIETARLDDKNLMFKSHPMWVRGLKLVQQSEIAKNYGRTLCGCVD